MLRYSVEVIGEEMIDLEETRQHIKALSDEDEDALIIEPLIAAAREYCENITGRAFCRQKVTACMDADGGAMRLPRTPVVEIERIRIRNESGEVEDLTDADYYLDRIDGEICLKKQYKQPDAMNLLEVIYTAGCKKLPAVVRQAMLMLIGHWYEQRTAVETGAVTSVDVAKTTEAILKQYRNWWF